MAWSGVTIGLRFTNGPDATTTPYRELTLLALALPPKWLAMDESVPPEGAGGYVRPARAHRLEMEAVIQTMTVWQGTTEGSAWDAGHYHVLVENTRAKRHYLTAVGHGGGAYPEVTRSPADLSIVNGFFGTVISLPHEVVVTVTDRGDERTSLRPTVMIRSAYPIIGTTIA